MRKKSFFVVFLWRLTFIPIVYAKLFAGVLKDYNIHINIYIYIYIYIYLTLLICPGPQGRPTWRPSVLGCL